MDGLATTRWVRRATLRGCASAELPSAVTLRALLEDGLRVADAADTRRVVLVRRLSVATPVTAWTAGSRQVHARLEDALGAAVARAQHASTADANATAIWFADWDDAVARLVQRWMDGHDASRWPWTSIEAWLRSAANAMPAAPAETPVARAAWCLVAWWHAGARCAPSAVDTRSCSRIAAARWAVAFAAHNRHAAFALFDRVAQIEPALARAPLAARSLRATTARSLRATTARSLDPAPIELHERLDGGVAGDVPQATVPVMRAREQPPRPVDCLLERLRVFVEQPSIAPAVLELTVARRLAQRGSTIEPPLAVHTQAMIHPAPAGSERAQEDEAHAHDVPGDTLVESAVAALGALLHTRAGGIGLLLNLLQRLGYGTWSEDEPLATHATTHALLRLALAVPDEDPVWRALPDIDHEVAPLAGLNLETHLPVRAPHRLARAARRLSTAVALCPQDAARRWIALARCALGGTGLDLRALSLRAARLAITPTHLDIVFPLDAADLRVRRLGLDQNPGWIPWFGRIVSLHFEAPARALAGVAPR